MQIHTELTVHDCAPELFTAFARVFPEKINKGTRWVTFLAEGVKVTLFAGDELQARADELYASDRAEEATELEAAETSGDPAELTFSGLYAAWRGDRIADSTYRAELRRRIVDAQERLAEAAGSLTSEGLTYRSGKLDSALVYASDYRHEQVPALVIDALAGIDSPVS